MTVKHILLFTPKPLPDETYGTGKGGFNTSSAVKAPFRGFGGKSYRLVLLLLCALLASVGSLNAQSKAATNDSLWCDYLNEYLKCASTYTITPRAGWTLPDTTDIAAFTPLLRLAPAGRETIDKQYNKVNYICYFFSGPKMADACAEFIKWHKKIRQCLELWDEGRFANSDPSLADYPDYFLTNSEDETSVRLSILKENGLYEVKMWIY